MQVNMMKLGLILLLFFAVLTFGACGPAASAHTQPLQAVAYPSAPGFDDYQTRSALRDANPVTEDFLTALDGFSCQTAELLLSGAAENANYSPLSLYYALALATSGAAGETQAQLLALLGVTDTETLSAQCGNLFRLLYADNEISQLKLANSLWLGQEFNGQPVSYENSFVENAAANFYAEVFSVDFSDGATGAAMGQWVAEHSNGVLAPDMQTDSQQLLSIINTVYFYDQWVDRFQESATQTAVFHTAAGDVETDFMNQSFGSAGFATGDGYTRAALSLKDSGAMTFILPDEGVSVDQLLSQGLAELLSGGQESWGEVIWSLPKFSFSAEYDLVETLQKLGVSAAFAEDADFSGITPHQAWISSIHQGTHIAVDEKGVEAAAFTQIDYAGAAMPQGRAEMILNRPFLYVITSGQGNLLFVGVVNDPTQE